MTTRKKLIEVALPLEAINIASTREKSISQGHPRTLHLWWARRPLAACRAVIFTSLVDDPDDANAPAAFVEACRALPKGKNALVVDTPRQRLFDFIEKLVQWESTTDEDVLNTARELILLSTDGNPPPLLDPFAGGGSIPLEAQRLGLEAHASDLNPVAVMINKAQIEIPPRFANQPPVNPRDRDGLKQGMSWKGAQGLAADVRYYGEWMRERAWERIGYLYPQHNGETIIAWFWARTVKCPNPACGIQMPLIQNFQLSKKKARRAWIEPSVNPRSSTIEFKVLYGDGKVPDSTVNRRGAQCIACNSPVSLKYIRDEGQAGRLGSQMFAIVTDGRGGRSYYSPTKEHEQIAQVSMPNDLPRTKLPEKALGFRIQSYGMTYHTDLFSPRQLLALTTLSSLIPDVYEKIIEAALTSGFYSDDTPLSEKGFGAKAYAEAVCSYLGIAISRQANRLSTLCFWDNEGEKVQQVFARNALPLTWDYVEANPFSDSSGNFLGQLSYLTHVVENLVCEVPGIAEQQDASNLNTSLNLLVSTDPPYYDNIGYADLSDYFYIWLRKSIGNFFPDLFGTMLTPKQQELIAEPARHESKEVASRFFEEGLFKVFEQIRQITAINYPTSIFYAFRQSESADDSSVFSSGWEVFLSGLIRASFQILGTWPIRTEQASGLRIIGRNALASSIVLVCRPRPDDAPSISRREFISLLRREVPAAIREMQTGNIAPVDLAQASIGPGMAVYSRYSRVLEADGTPLSVRVALQLINQVLDEYLAESEGDVDADTRFAINWFEQFGFEAGEFGVADVLARAKNTSVEGLVNAGVIRAAAGKVQLLHWSELDAGWDPTTDHRPTVWEAVHHLIQQVDAHGEVGGASLLLKMNPDLSAEARSLAYRLYQVCDRKGWADRARDYNGLVVLWPGLQEQASELKRNRPEQLGLL